MRLVDGIGVVVAELVHDLLDPVVVLGGEQVPDESLKLEGAALALVVELIVEGFGDVDVHAECSAGQLLHGGPRRGSQRCSRRPAVAAVGNKR